MTDFATEPLWEEDAQEPEMVKKPPHPEPDPMAGAGNGATAQAVKAAEVEAEVEATPPKPAMMSDAPAKAANAKAQTTEQPVPETITEPTSEKAKTKPPEAEAKETLEPVKPKTKAPKAEPAPKAKIDWQKPLNAVLQGLHNGQLGRTLPKFLKIANHIPAPQLPAVAGMIVSSFLRLPMAQRQTVRATLIDAFKAHPKLPIAQLILIRLGGVPVAPPPPPPAPPGDA